MSVCHDTPSHEGFASRTVRSRSRDQSRDLLTKNAFPPEPISPRSKSSEPASAPLPVTEKVRSDDTSRDRSPVGASDAQHGPLDGGQVEHWVSDGATAAPLFSSFTMTQKQFIVFMAAWAGFFSAVSGNIYYPALVPLARDLGVSNTLINLTLTSYMIFQGLAPTFLGDFADMAGRRPAYTICFTIYILANLGLALQNSYAALFVLRCFQSTGSSATIAMSSAIVSDIATAAERGKYMGFTSAGALLGPAIGPVIGGVLAEFIGWRAIFWFLMILAAAWLLIFATFFPETARKHVGDGSIPPKGLNMSLMNYLAVRRARRSPAANHPEVPGQAVPAPSQQPVRLRFPNPLRSLHIIWDRENALLLWYNAFIFAAFYDVGAALPSQLDAIFGFNELQIGLCYLPFGLGTLGAALFNGQLLDRNFARWCRRLGLQIKKGRNQDLSKFPIEKVRLQIGIPAAYAASILVCVFGWLLHLNGPLAPLLVVLFFLSFSFCVAFNVTTNLLVDFYPSTPATATAANNLIRCLLGAGATAAVVPMINALGSGWTFTLLSLLLIAASPMLWLVYLHGMKWRSERNEKEELAKRLKQDNSVGQERGEGKVQSEGRADGPLAEVHAPEKSGPRPDRSPRLPEDVTTVDEPRGRH